MKLDVLDLYLYEALLFTLGASPCSGLWASLGRREVGLCQMFTAAYPSLPVQHISAINWESMESSQNDPGAYLLNMELEFSERVLGFATRTKAFCFVGLYAGNGCGKQRLTENLTEETLFFDLQFANQFEFPLKLFLEQKPVRVVLSIENEALSRIGSLLKVEL